MIPQQQFLEEIKKRQQIFCQQIDSIHIFFSATEKKRNRDVYFPFRQDSSLHYLTGFPEANAIAIFEPDGTYSLFVQPKDTNKELWTGYRYGVKEAQKIFLIDHTYNTQEFTTILSKIIANKTITLTDENQKIKLPQNLVNKTIVNNEIITQMRLIKSDWEITQMRYASKISSQAHRKMINERLKFNFEYEYEALFHYETIKKGALQMAYPAIIAGGENACTLHYNHNNAKINNNDLILIDAGCEWQKYAADITRTFPASHKFNSTQKLLYQIVLDTQIKAIEAVSTQISMQEIHQLSCRQITTSLIDIGILNGSVDENITNKTYCNYFPHGIGHLLGLDVHDITTASQTQNKLQNGMAFTIEPGLYFQPNDTTVPLEFRGIGIRIEDNIIIKNNHYENLTTAPKLIDEIELEI